MQRSFATPRPVSLVVELRAGDLAVTTTETDRTQVEVTGSGDLTDVVVDQYGDEIVVISKSRGVGFFGSADHPVSVRVTVPHDSRLTTKLGSADVRVQGRLGESVLRSGSGDVRLDELGGETSIETGSGDVQVELVRCALRVRCGSGNVTVDRLAGPARIVTGSGDVVVSSAEEPVSVKSGSGDMRVRLACDDVALSTASGDLVVDQVRGGRLSAKNVSGDIAVGVAAGVPVWTDVLTMSGSVRSTLAGAGEPGEGEPFVELRAKTVSGDVLLEQV